MLAYIAMLNAGFMALLPKALMVLSVALMIGCPASALLFPKRKGDPIFHHHVL